MLYTKLLHPTILRTLGSNGHGAKILIADGNFPVSTCTAASSEIVFLNFSPNLLSVTQVLQVLTECIPIESALMMVPSDETLHPVHHEIRNILHQNIPIIYDKRMEFYKQAMENDICLAIATGETRRFANILITIGSVIPLDE